MKNSLSSRLRPNCECAPWVVEEVKKLEEKLEMLEAFALSVHTNSDGPMTMNDRSFMYKSNGVIQDLNFDFDAILKVNGDFGSEELLDKYCQMITAALNNTKKKASIGSVNDNQA